MTKTRDARLQLAETLHRLTAEVKRHWTRLRVLVPFEDFELGVRPILGAAHTAIDAAGTLAREVAQVDAFVMAVLDGVRTSVRFAADDRPRALLYSILVSRELETLALGRPVVDRAREAARNDVRALYSDLGPGWQDLDPATCWFTEGAPADPDASLIVDLFKVTSITYSEYDCLHVPVLIPRSKAAKWVHTGRRAEQFDPAWIPLTLRDASVQRSKTERDQRVRELDAALADLEAAEQVALQAALAEFDAELPARREQLAQAAAAAETEGEAIARSERKRAEAALVELSQQFKPAVARARRWAERIDGWTWTQFELPLTVAVALAALSLQALLGGLLAVALGGLLGFGAAWWTRRSLQRGPARVEQRFRDQLKSVRKNASNRVSSHGERLRTEAQAALAALDGQRAAILAESEQRLDQARRDRDEQVAAIEATRQEELTARPLKDCESYPAILIGLDNGFMHGKAPSKELIQVLHDQKYSSYVNSLSPDGRERLVRERNRLPRKEFDQLIERLIS